MTRVTESMIFTSLMNGVSRAQEQLLLRSQRAHSGRRVERPSDDPMMASRGLVADAGLRRLAAMGQAADLAHTDSSAAHAALRASRQALERAYALAVEGGSGAFSAADRATMAAELAGLRDSVLAAANTRAGATYVFGGLWTAGAPFLPSGVFVGDANARLVEAAAGEQVTVGGSGALAFTAAGGQNVFAVLDAIGAALLADDPATVRANLGALEQAQGQVLAEEARVGASLQRLERAAATRTSLTETFRRAREAALELDTTLAYVELQQAQQGFEAVISATASILSTLEQGSRL